MIYPNSIRLNRKTTSLFKLFLKRFTTATLESLDASDNLIVSTIIQGLREGELHISLARKTPRNFDDLLQRATKCINLEDAVKLKKAKMPGKTDK